jgi:hypothetical protein
LFLKPQVSKLSNENNMLGCKEFGRYILYVAVPCLSNFGCCCWFGISSLGEKYFCDCHNVSLTLVTVLTTLQLKDEC